jgi:hypothetical protein
MPFGIVCCFTFSQSTFSMAMVIVWSWYGSYWLLNHFLTKIKWNRNWKKIRIRVSLVSVESPPQFKFNRICCWKSKQIAKIGFGMKNQLSPWCVHTWANSTSIYHPGELHTTQKLNGGERTPDLKIHKFQSQELYLRGIVLIGSAHDSFRI